MSGARRTSLLALVLAADDASRMGDLVAELAHTCAGLPKCRWQRRCSSSTRRAPARVPSSRSSRSAPFPDIGDDLATDADADAGADAGGGAGGGDAGAQAAAALPLEQQLTRFRRAAGAGHAAVAAGLAALDEKQEEVKTTQARLTPRDLPRRPAAPRRCILAGSVYIR